ncbi:hypothetical protein BV20DRAFT_968304 [Pilatotrama ljubarskyi]|nr:hypothetical protein BV20DRAFT_968304 [Pilatotrama ljubarskyi]
MPRAAGKGNVSGSESDNEHTRSARRRSASASKNAPKDKERVEDKSGEQDDDDDEGDEEEFEIEAILDAKHGTFPEGRVGYLVKWKGYGDEHNSWVDENDATGAKDLISEFWKKHKKGPRKSEPKPKPGPKPRKSSVKDADSDIEEVAPPKKRGRPKATSTRETSDEEEDDQSRKQKKPRKSAGSANKATKRKSTAADAVEEDGEMYTDMRKWADAASWEHLVKSIDTVERTDDGDLYVYFTLKNGKGHAKEKSELCKKKMPYKLIEFYESNLRWKPSDDNAMEE